MSRYNKAIAAVIGGAITTLAALGVISAELATAENIETVVAGVGAIITLGAAIATYWSPKNKD